MKSENADQATLGAGERIDALISTKGWILADGATGTSLFALGLEAGDAPELLNLENPEWVRAVCREAMVAGSDLVLTNSFGGNRERLKLHSAENQTGRLCELSARLARDAADEVGSQALVAGSMGPTGGLLEPVGEMSRSQAIEIFHEQADALKEGGADLFWIETMSDLNELECAAEGCNLAGLPYCATMSFDTSGRTMMGVQARDLEDWANAAAKRPIAYGCNCGAGAADLVRTLLEFGSPKHGMHLIAKGNAGIPKWLDGSIHYEGSPELMANYAELARRAGAGIIGGCCGTTAAHLASMRERLEQSPAGVAPEADEIIRRLGNFSSVLAASGSRVPPRRRRRRSS